MRRFSYFLRLPRSRRRIRHDIADEFQLDIDMRARDLAAQGMDADAAYERAAREFGDLEAARHYCEDMDMRIEAEARRRNLFEEIWADVAIAMRGMRHRPGFAAVVLLTLALGIGANTAVFSVVRRVLIADLPFRAPSQLYRLYTTPAATDGDNDKLSLAELTLLDAESQSTDGITFFGNYQGVTYSDDRSAESWQAVSVAPNFFDVFGVQPVLGRAFRAEEFQTAAPDGVIVSYGVWQRTFGGDRGAVGRIIQINGKPFSLIGVLPANFVGPTFDADALFPLNVSVVKKSPGYFRSRAWRAVARLKPEVSPEQWRAELSVVRQHIATAYPQIKNGGVVLPTPLHEAIVGGAGPVLWLIMGSALIVLLATCVNIAGLFLSRASARRRELGVRAALGAGRGRLIRGALIETLLYGAVGGALGVLLAIAMKAALLHNIGEMLPKVGDVRIDAAVLCFALAASTLAGLVFGVLPAFGATRIDVRDALGDGGSRAVSRGTVAARSSRLLVSLQMAFALVLVIGASLLVRTFAKLLSSDLGYEATGHQATFFLSTGAVYREAATRAAFEDAFMQRVRAIPGVTAIGSTVTNPWNGSWISPHFEIAGRPAATGDRPSAVLATASVEYFKAMGMRLRAGRGFTASDANGGAPVVVVSESMARRYWPNSTPVGTRIRLADFYARDPSDTLVFREVVGVIGDVRASATSEALPTLYVSSEQTQVGGGAYVVRTTGDASALIPLMKEIVRQLNPRVPMISPRTLRDVLTTIVRRQQVAMTLTSVFAVLALMLAGLGVYGMMSYTVLVRRRELGIRSALGSSRGAMLKLVLREAVATMTIGLATGLVCAIALARLVSSLLFGMTARDPASYAIAAVVLGCVALAACALPLRAAMRIDPAEALRLE
jgi:predicted permease